MPAALQITWLKHRKAKKAHGFIQLGGGGVKPWIVSLCRDIRFRPGDLTHQMHELFTKDMRESTDDFCKGCVEKFSEAEAQPKVQMKWPSVKCPECGGKAWMTDSQFIIVCDHCRMNYAVQEPLYDKEPKVQTNDQQESGAKRSRPRLVGATDGDGDRSEVSNADQRPNRVDGVEAEEVESEASEVDEHNTKH